MSLSWFDILVLAAMILLGFKGMFSGLIREVFGLVGLIGGVFIASKYSSATAGLISSTIYKIESQSIADFVGFLTGLILFWLLCIILGNILARLVKLSGLGILDRIGGFVFGAGKVFLIFAIVIFCLTRISFLESQVRDFTGRSLTLPWLKSTGEFIMNQPAAQDGLQKAGENLQNLQKSTVPSSAPASSPATSPAQQGE